MPRIIHVIEQDYIPSFRSSKIVGLFDVPVKDKLRKEWNINVPLEDKEWNVGLIVGASGSGKTTLGKKIFNNIHTGFSWTQNCFLDDFPENCDLRAITETLSRVGFSSPPAWLLPYSALSTGQKFRAELARCLLEYPDLIVFDEFTSVVDRQIAQIGSFAYQKAIRHANKKFVAITCHYDVEPWLQPDWVLDVSKNEFTWGCLRRPSIEYKIQRCNYSAWELFKDHHYLSNHINKASICFLGSINNRPVAFDSWLPFFGRLSGTKKGRRGHRTVVLPDFQGLGLGNILFTEISKMWAGLNFRVFSGTAHPAEIKKRIESSNWKLTRQGRTGKDGYLLGGGIKRANNRLTAGFEFVGSPMNKDEAERLLAF